MLNSKLLRLRRKLSLNSRAIILMVGPCVLISLLLGITAAELGDAVDIVEAEAGVVAEVVLALGPVADEVDLNLLSKARGLHSKHCFLCISPHPLVRRGDSGLLLGSDVLI